MRRYISLILILTIVCGCDSEQRRSLREFLGMRVVAKGYYKNGNLKFERSYLGGVLDGPAAEYFEEDGAIQFRSNYKDNFLEGTRSEFLINGALGEKCEYSHGFKTKCESFYGGGRSIQTFDADERMITKTDMERDGRLIDAWRFAYTDSGQITTNRDGSTEEMIVDKASNASKLRIYRSVDGTITKVDFYDSAGIYAHRTLMPVGARDEVWSAHGDTNELLGWWENSIFYNAKGKRISMADRNGNIVYDDESIQPPGDKSGFYSIFGPEEVQIPPALSYVVTPYAEVSRVHHDN